MLFGLRIWQSLCRRNITGDYGCREDLEYWVRIWTKSYPYQTVSGWCTVPIYSNILRCIISLCYPATKGRSKFEKYIIISVKNMDKSDMQIIVSLHLLLQNLIHRCLRWSDLYNSAPALHQLVYAMISLPGSLGCRSGMNWKTKLDGRYTQQLIEISLYLTYLILVRIQSNGRLSGRRGAPDESYLLYYRCLEIYLCIYPCRFGDVWLSGIDYSMICFSWILAGYHLLYLFSLRDVWVSVD